MKKLTRTVLTCVVLVFTGLFPVVADDQKKGQASGIVGQAFLSFNNYCVTFPDGQPCPDARPTTGTILVYSEREELVATVETDQDGFFKVSLKPGNYRLEPYIPPVPPGSAIVGTLDGYGMSVSVNKKEFTSAWVLYVHRVF